MAGGDTTIDLACVGKKLICDNWSVPSTTALSGAALLETPDAITKCLAQQAEFELRLGPPRSSGGDAFFCPAVADVMRVRPRAAFISQIVRDRPAPPRRSAQAEALEPTAPRRGRNP